MATLAPVLSHSRKGAESRQRILNAAAKLFSLRGYAATSMRDISEHSKLKVAAIYHHFTSKEELLLAVESEAFLQMRQLVENAIKKETDAWRRLEAACCAHMTGVLINREYVNVTTRELPENHSAVVRQKLRYLREEYENIFRDLISHLPLPKTVDRSLFRLTLLGAMAWSMVWYRADRGAPEDVARSMLNLLRFGTE